MYSKTTAKWKNLLLYLYVLILFPNFLLAFSPGTGARPTLESGPSLAIQANLQLDEFFQKNTETQLEKMTLDEKIGQLFIIGFPYDEFDKNLENQISKYKYGSFILFKKNIKNFLSLKKLNQDLKAFSLKNFKIPPLLAVDQEGGNVTRIETKPRMPYFFHLGNINSKDLIYKFAHYTASILTSLGFNLNLAPVLDLSSPGENSFMALRSFGNDPFMVSSLGFSYSKGLLDHGVIPTAKHFPGIGNSLVDPHVSISKRTIALAEIETKDLLPFKKFSTLSPASVVMLSHMIYQQLDPSQLPATFSNYIIEELLRKKVGFSGVVMTDDLQMKASRESLPPPQAAMKALVAGADMIMISWSSQDQKKTFDLIKSEVLKGRFSIKLLDQKVARILNLKKVATSTKSPARELSSEKPADLEFKSKSLSGETATFLASRDIASLQENIFNKKVTSAFLDAALVTDGKVCVVSNMSNIFKDFNRPELQNFLGFRFPLNTRVTQLNNFFEQTPCQVFFVIVESLDQIRVLNQCHTIKNKKVVLFNYALPSAIKNRQHFFNVIDLYGLKQNDADIFEKNLKEFSSLILSKRKNNISIN